MAETQVREFLVDQLRKAIIGPVADEEEIDDLPTNNYLGGILYPRDTHFDPADDDAHNDSASDDEGEEDEPAPSLSQSLRPSSIGFTCELDASVRKIRLDVSFGIYSPKALEGEKYPKWKRKAHKLEFDLDLGATPEPIELPPSGKIRWTVSPRPHRGSLVLSLFLINTSRKDDISEHIFQPRIALEGLNGQRPFIQRNYGVFPGTTRDSDDASLDLLFRDKFEFAIGHGISVVWTDVVGDHCGSIQTEFIPSF